MGEARPTPNQKLRHERERRAWSQQDVADKVGTTPLNVGRWERGITMPGPYFRQRLCEIFEKSASELGLVHENTGAGTPIEVPPHTPSTTPAQETLPVLWNVPYNRNPLFTGREDILTQVYLALTSADQPLALTQPQAISGLGGIGKTQTAVEYAYRYRDRYEAVFWARADSPELLSSDYLLLAALLNLPQRNEQDQTLVVKAVLRWFDTHEGWLLILDNADDLEMVNAFIPSAGKGHVLLTTRAHSTGTIAGRIELETMGLEEGMVLLLRRAKLLKGSASSLQAVPDAVRSSAQAIVEAVDGLPLALDQAGAYIEGTGCSLSDYLKFYKTHRHRLLRKRGESAVGHPEPVATTWSLSFEKVERANPAAAELLRLCAFLHPDEIPEAMIAEGASELGPILQPVAEDEMELNEAIGELRKYSLVKRDPEKKILNIHRLVQAVIKDRMDKETQREWAERVVKIVNRAFPLPEINTWPKCQQYLPHVRICSRLIEQWNILSFENTHFLKNAGLCLQEHGQYAEAEHFLQQTIAIREQVLGPLHPQVAESLNNLAELYWIESKYQEGEQLYLRAITIREQMLGLDHADVAQSLNGLALIYREQDKYPQAEPLLRRALEIRERVLGPAHSDVAETLNNLGLLLHDQGQDGLAEPFLRRALVIYEHNLGVNHSYISTVLNNLALISFAQRKYEETESLFQRALFITEQALGPNHPEVSTRLNNLAALYHIQGSYEHVEQLLQRALAIDEESLGQNHPDIALRLHNLATLFRKQGKYAQAEAFFHRSLAIREQVLGPAHHRTADTIHAMAVLYQAQMRIDLAEAFFRRALTIREQVFGPEHPETLVTLENLASLLHEANRETEATILEARAQAIRAKQE